MVVEELPVRHASLLSKLQPVLQHLCLSNSSAVQIRLPSSEHMAWALSNVVSKHESGLTQVRPSLLQHLTAPVSDFDGISIDFNLSLPWGSPGHPSPRFPRFC